MHFHSVVAVGLVCLGLSNLNPASAAPTSLHPDVQIRFLLNAASGSKPVRLVKDPRDNALYYLKQSGTIYRVTVNPGSGTSVSSIAIGAGEHGISSASGLAIGPDGTMYVVGNTTTNNNNSTFATIMKGVLNTSGGRAWSNLARTEPYPRSKTAFDHVFNGIVVSLDGQFILLNSGSRTDHGEEQSVGGAFPGAREVPLTAKIFRLPASGSNLILSNNLPALQSAGYIYAEGTRNTYDFAFAPNGDLFGTENGPDRDMSEELNWLREGLHFGFPWRIGGTDNPQQFPAYDPAADRLLDPRFIAVQSGYYRNDPSFPPAPNGLNEPVINLGPDADSYRDPADGSIQDSSDLGQTMGTFTAHRSPLGLVFDTAGVLTPEFRNHGFMLSWTPGDPNGTNVAGPFKDPSQDLLDLDLTKLGSTNYQARITRLVGGFSNPIDAEIIANRIYVIEYGGNTGIWEITLPVEPTVATTSATNVTATAATLSGTVNPNGVPTTAWFEWGANTGYGTLTSSQNTGSGTNAVDIIQTLSSLLPGGTYHYRIVASNAFTVAYGTDRTFTTTTSQNSPPVAQGDTAATPEDSTLALSAASLLVNDSDADVGDVLTVTAVSPASAQSGNVSLNDGTVTYSPATNFFGNDSFTYVVSDSFGLMATGTVAVAVTPVNDPPVALDDNSVTLEDVVVILSAATLTANDSVGPANESNQTLAVSSVSPASAHGGTVTLSGASITYLPPTNYFGADTFTYDVTDGQVPLVQATATVTVNISAVNDVPLVTLRSPTNGAAFSAHSTLPFIADASDPDGTVSRVDFHISPALILSATNSSPGEFTATWTNVPSGAYSVSAEAVDDQNATNTSATVNFTLVDLRLDRPAFASDGSLQFDLIGAPGNSYRVDASTNFQDWDPLASVLATNGTVRITDPTATNRWLRYYRALVP